jgi:hypothetical protein
MLMKIWMLISAGVTFVCIGTAQSSTISPMNSDLAIILPAQRDLRIAAQDTVSPLREPLLPRDLLGQVEAAFRTTSIGDALAEENSYADWTLVSLRIVPCSPLGMIPNGENQVLCWPEIRLVWQPILKDFRRYAVILKAFADDRAIHALYDFSPELVLTPSEAQRASALLNRIRTTLASKPTAPLAQLTTSELNEFVQLRDKASDYLIQSTLQLRTGSISENAYTQLDERPEFNDTKTATLFIQKLKFFLARSVPRSALKEMTSFSLPEGRDPPQLDEWVFIQFIKQNQKMVQQRILMHSAEDGRPLFDFGLAPRASQMRDEPELYSALETMNSINAEEIKKRVLLSPSEVKQKNNIINDRALTLVPNTSCASCHKFNDLRFDFHALSYLEDRTISISPRVRTDVLRDLEWLKKRSER